MIGFHHSYIQYLNKINAYESFPTSLMHTLDHLESILRIRES